MQEDVGYVPVAWVLRYGAKKPWVGGVEKNKAGEFVVDGNIYVDRLQHCTCWSAASRDALGETGRAPPLPLGGAPAPDRLSRHGVGRPPP